MNGSDEEVEDDDPPEQDTDFSDDDNKRDHEDVKSSCSFMCSCNEVYRPFD